MAVRAFALFALLFLGWGIESWGIAGPYVDPVGRIRAQDEAVYSHIAIQMAQRGDWLTPRFLDRFALFKPPLAYWLAGASVKTFGVSRTSLRLHSIVAGAVGAVLVFLWVRRGRSVVAAGAAGVMVVTSALWYTLSRLALVDATLAALFLAAAFTLMRDEGMEQRATPWLYGLFAGCALMTKGIAGLLPLAALGLYWLLRRPRFFAVVTAGGCALMVAAPWHLYQLFANSRWFLAEYVGVEILRYAVGAPPQTSQDSTAAFYFARFFTLDPVLAVLGAAGLVLAIRRKQDLPAVSLAAILIAAVFGYQYRNIAYWLPLVPLAALLAARHLPVPLVAGAATVKLVLAVPLLQQSWQTPPAPVLAEYCERQRGNDLYLIALDDDFQATTLPLAHVRYVFIAPPPEYGSAALDFHRLGVTQTVGEFLGQRQPPEDLLAWGLPDRRALATVVLARDLDEVHKLIAARPEADFLLTEDQLGGANVHHEIIRGGNSRVLLLSRQPKPRPGGARWSCRL